MDKNRIKIASRVANLWFDNFVNNTHDIHLDIEEVKKSIKIIADKIRIKDFNYNLFRRYVIDDILRESKSLIGNITNFNIDATRIRNRHDVCHKDVLNDTLFAFSHFGDNIRYSKNRVVVLTDEIILEDINLGCFEISINLVENFPGRNVLDLISILAKNPCTPHGDDNVVHPHVSYSSGICFGDAAESVKNNIISGNVFNVFDIIIKFLNTYNDDSPYIPMSEWDRPVSICHNCDMRISEDDSIRCENCYDMFCPDCSCWCEYCMESKCNNCVSIIRCDYCRSYVCDIHIHHSCGMDLCEPCFNKMIFCEKCGDRVWEEHVVQCNRCSLYFCTNCSNKTDKCNTCLSENGECVEDEKVDA